MATTPTPEGSKEHTSASAAPRSLVSHLLLWAFGIAAAGMLVVGLLVGVALAMAYPQLPDISDLADYRPKLSMRVYSVEGTQIGEFGEERRNLTPFKDIPKVMKDAVLAIEDARFYQHGGWTISVCCAPAWPTWAAPKVKARRPSRCRWRATSICHPRKHSRARFMKFC